MRIHFQQNHLKWGNGNHKGRQNDPDTQDPIGSVTDEDGFMELFD